MRISRRIIASSGQVHLPPLAKPSARVLGITLAAAPILYGSSLLLERLSEAWVESHLTDNLWVGAYFVVVWFLLPLAAFMIPCATVAWLGIAMASSCHETRVTRLSVASLLIAATLSVLGEKIRGLYGFDPPYVLFFLGSGMQFVAEAMPYAAMAWLAVAFRMWYRERFTPTR